MVAVVVAVILGIAIIGLWASGVFSSSKSSPGGGGVVGGPVNITAINFNTTSEVNICWVSAPGPGGTVTAGQTFWTNWTLPYPEGGSCTVQTVTMQTSGFSVEFANTPLVVKVPGPQTLTIAIGTPRTSYTGEVTIEMTVTSP
ncbi:MAG: hypothetical protein ABSA63_04155 [Thermoplasmata archaeon]|jgi:hypothetical protein